LIIEGLVIAAPILVAIFLRILAKKLATRVIVSIITISYYPMFVLAVTAFCGRKCEIDWTLDLLYFFMVPFVLLITPIVWVHILLTFAIALFNRPDPEARN